MQGTPAETALGNRDPGGDRKKYQPDAEQD